MYEPFQRHLRGELEQIRQDGLYKGERLITSPQGAHVELQGRAVINLCANNYLGLAQDPAVNAPVKAACQPR